MSLMHVNQIIDSQTINHYPFGMSAKGDEWETGDNPRYPRRRKDLSTEWSDSTTFVPFDWPQKRIRYNDEVEKLADRIFARAISIAWAEIKWEGCKWAHWNSLSGAEQKVWYRLACQQLLSPQKAIKALKDGVWHSR